MPPWWEQEQSSPDITITGPNLRCIPLLLPLALLAPFSEISTMFGTFPLGYYCTSCGRINFQRFLRHRICEGATCNFRTEPEPETSWAVSAFSTHDRKIASAKIVPDNNWAAPTTEGPATAFDDGARLFLYYLALGDSIPSAAPSILHPSGAGTAHSVRHVFNGNNESLQGDASALFENLQRDVRIERNIGASVFTTPLIECRNDPALGRRGHSVWDLQVSIIGRALDKYCCDLGPLRVRSLRVHAWSSSGKVRMPVAHGQPLRSHTRYSFSTIRCSVHAPSTSCCYASVPTLGCSLFSQVLTPRRKAKRRKSAFASRWSTGTSLCSAAASLRQVTLAFINIH
jgi:hypothetical protein